MNREVYRYLLVTYGKSWGVWLSITTEVVRTIIARVYVVILLSQIVNAVAVGNFGLSKHYVILCLIWSVIGVCVGAVAVLVGTLSENRVYSRILPLYYEKLTNKDMSFFRDHQTGYLTTLFRQYLDSGILLVRLIRGDFTRTLVTLIAPVVVLLVASWKVGLVALALVVTQIMYIFWASAKANVYRSESHKVYREVTGEVADDITNIVAYKSSGSESISQKRLMSLHAQESHLFWLRRKVVVLLDLPRNLTAVILISVSFWVVASASSSTSQSVG